MLILPLPAAPDWRRPPWVTLAIIVICSFIFLFLQLKDGPIEARAYSYYLEHRLHELELPRYLEHLRQNGHATAADNDTPRDSIMLLLHMQTDEAFMRRLHQDEIIRPDEPRYPAWKAQRAEFEKLLAQSFTDRFILKPANPTWYGLLMHMFMHGSVDHLLGNMAILFIVGYTVEAALGSGRFLAFYILSGLGATAADLVLRSDSFVGTLGASGAIAGVMAMFVVIYGLRKIRFFYFLFFYMGTLHASALLVLPVWLGKELLQKVMNPGSHVNYYAHFCGLLTGALLATCFRWRRGWQTAEHVIAQENDAATKKLQLQAENLFARMQFEPATRLYAKLTAAQPQDRKLAIDFYQAARLQPDTHLREQACQLILTLNTGAQQTTEAWQYLIERKARLPKLTNSDWARLAASWIDGRFLVPAEQLLRMLSSKSGQHPGLPTQLYRLGQAFMQAKQDERAFGCWRILIRHYPQSAEAQLVRKPSPSSAQS